MLVEKQKVEEDDAFSILWGFLKPKDKMTTYTTTIAEPTKTPAPFLNFVLRLAVIFLCICWSSNHVCKIQD